MLRLRPQGASEPVLKVLESAIANARVKADKTAERFDERELVVAAAYVDRAPMKRFRPRARPRRPDQQAHEPHHRGRRSPGCQERR